MKANTIWKIIERHQNISPLFKVHLFANHKYQSTLKHAHKSTKTLGGAEMATLRKLAALVVMALFVLSIVPLALAGKDQSGLSREGQNQENGDANVAEDGEAASDDNVPAERESRRERMDSLREEGKKLKDRVAHAREEFEKVKDQYKEKKHEFEQKKEELKQLNEHAKACKDDSEDCKAKKVDLKRGVKQHLIKTVELIDRSLEKLTNRVESSKVLDDAQKEQALSSIAALEEQLTAKKEEIQALADDAPKEELKAKIKELKSLWQDVRKEQRRIIADLISHKQESIGNVYAKFGDRVEAQLNKLAEQGADVSKAQELLAQYRAKVDELNAVPAGEREQFKQVMHDAKEILRDLLKELKNLKKGLKSEAEEQENESAAEHPTNESAANENGEQEGSAEAEAPVGEESPSPAPEVPAEEPIQEAPAVGDNSTPEVPAGQ